MGRYILWFILAFLYYICYLECWYVFVLRFDNCHKVSTESRCFGIFWLYCAIWSMVKVTLCFIVYMCNFICMGNTCDLWLLQGFVLLSSCEIMTLWTVTVRVSHPWHIYHTLCYKVLFTVPTCVCVLKLFEIPIQRCKCDLYRSIICCQLCVWNVGHMFSPLGGFLVGP